MTGVYKIQNTVSGNFYIGSTSNNFKVRFRAHLRDLNNGVHHCEPLQRAWNKYGPSAFNFEILCATLKDQAVSIEQVYLDWLKPKYNTCKIAGSALGVKRTKEFGENISNRMQGNTIWRGRTHNEESKLKIGIANKGKIPACAGKAMSEETKAKISLKNTGSKRSEESKKLMSEKSKGRKPWNTGLKGVTKSWNKGLTLSKDYVDKMREAKLKYQYEILHLETSKVFTTTNLTQFCKDNNLQVTNLYLTAPDKLKKRERVHKGYKIILKQPIK